jgi:hypothetical protein
MIGRKEDYTEKVQLLLVATEALLNNTDPAAKAKMAQTMTVKVPDYDLTATYERHKAESGAERYIFSRMEIV